MFEKQIIIFENIYSIIVWDARGHGFSKLNNGKKFSFQDMYFDCLKLFEIHNIKKSILIGQSMG
jgi:pimeloyl-ACP methyl ester carboxylesterase